MTTDKQRTLIESKITVEGFHYWKNAPEEVAFLRNSHRHLFVIRVGKRVFHDDRDVEFILFGRKIKKYLQEIYSVSSQYVEHDIQLEYCDFGGRSCEMIARELLEQFDLEYCSVYEDDENGSIVEKIN